MSLKHGCANTGAIEQIALNLEDDHAHPEAGGQRADQGRSYQ